MTRREVAGIITAVGAALATLAATLLWGAVALLAAGLVAMFVGTFLIDTGDA